jgi:hypothetical protein
LIAGSLADSCCLSCLSQSPPEMSNTREAFAALWISGEEALQHQGLLLAWLPGEQSDTCSAGAQSIAIGSLNTLTAGLWQEVGWPVRAWGQGGAASGVPCILALGAPLLRRRCLYRSV